MDNLCGQQLTECDKEAKRQSVGECCWLPISTTDSSPSSGPQTGGRLAEPRRLRPMLLHCGDGYLAQLSSPAPLRCSDSIVETEGERTCADSCFSNTPTEAVTNTDTNHLPEHADKDRYLIEQECKKMPALECIYRHKKCIAQQRGLSPLSPLWDPFRGTVWRPQVTQTCDSPAARIVNVNISFVLFQH